ncbi:beta-lactamase family protein [Inquilinus limosus]|uniref:serine hydrolase domain-containing protein n=1 Tax=Inquilinus limosus TaxID=171674 RepID=UPI003F18CAF5
MAPNADSFSREALSNLLSQTTGLHAFAAAAMIDGRIVLEHRADDALCACSTFKVAAATAVMSLVQEGVIELDRPIRQYDDGLEFSDPAVAQAITLRHLLSHTSGLDDTDDVELHPRQRLRSLPFVALPGRAFRYSNVGFDIAVLIAARAAGLSYQDLLRTRVLAPLAMDGTHWRSGFPLHSPFTTARDLMRLADEHLDGARVLSSAALADMHRIHADSFTASSCRFYGLGIDVERWANRTLLSHGGGLYRYGTAFVIDPASRAAVAFLFDDPAGYAVSPHALLDRLLDRRTTPEAPRANTTDWAPYIGRYDNGAQLSSRAGRLSLKWKGRQHRLKAVDERLFASDEGVSVGLLPGTPTMISVNDFILIGARPGRLLHL